MSDYMTSLIIAFVIAGVLMAIEYLLCTKLKNPLWGGILPLLIVAGTIFAFASGKVPFERNYIFPFALLNIMFLEEWNIGREKYKKLQQAETDKMKAQDIE